MSIRMESRQEAGSLIALLKYLKGYVRIRVWGFSPERFMNLCSMRNILLWDIVREGEAYEMSVSLRAFYRLRPIVRKTGTRAVILKRVGLPFFIPVICRRKIFVLGLLSCIAFWMLSAGFVWDIRLQGNFQITEDAFLSFLKEASVTVGMRKKELAIEELEKEIRRRFPLITWTSVRIDGTKLLIDIKENDTPAVQAVKEEEEKGQDLVSQYDGVITSMIVRSGVPRAAIGDSVEKGQILVEGRVPVYNEDATVREYHYVVSDADIVVRHEVSCRETLPYDYVRREYTGREKERFFVRAFDRELKWMEEQPFLVYDSVIRQKTPALFEKLSIPVFWGSITCREYQNVEYEYTLEQAKALLTEKMEQKFLSLQEKGVQIIEKNVKIDTENGEWVIEGLLTVEEKAGVLADTVAEMSKPPEEAAQG